MKAVLTFEMELPPLVTGDRSKPVEKVAYAAMLKYGQDLDFVRTNATHCSFHIDY